MLLTLLPKPSLQAFIETCTPLAKVDVLEQAYRERVDSIAAALLRYVSTDDTVENLSRFLKADTNFLGIILALTNLSQEKFLRILSAERFARGDFGKEWGIDTIHRKLKSEEGFAERVAQLFLEGRNNKLLVEQVASFYLDQLSLPTEWADVIQDANLIHNVIRRKLAGEYSDAKGDAIESIIRSYLDDVQGRYGVTHGKGQVHLVRKEVDHALPNTADAHLLIMTSYMETTSSSQTTRANEQSEMFLALQGENIRYGTKRVLVNFVDGAGWLARRSDLRKLYDGCDYIINLRTLDRLEAIICKYVPEHYFTVSPHPQVEG